ncbi:MAG: NUDIX domain-containing protein [Candidatus Paceibacterota bacterium]
MIEIPKILSSVEKRLGRENPGAVATGIGVFVLIKKDGSLLLKTRLPKEGGVGVGKFELPGGAIDIADFVSGEYASAPVRGAVREAREETGLLIRKEGPVLLTPAWAIYQAGDQIDLAFSFNVSWDEVEETEEYRKLLESGDLVWVPEEKLGQISFISKRMKYLATGE